MSDLFEGLQIMTPQELESSMGGNSSETVSNDVTTTTTSTGEFEILPPQPKSDEVSSNSNEDDSTEDDNDAPENANSGESDSPGAQSSSSDAKGSAALYKAFIKDMVKEGIISVEDGEDLEALEGNADTIKQLMDKTLDKKFQQKQEAWKNSLPKAKRRFLEIEDAFDSEDHAIQMAERLEFFDNLSEEDLDNEKLQKQIYFEYLKSKNYSDEEANEEVEDADALGKLREKADKALPQLRKQAETIISQSREEKVKAQQQHQEKVAEQFNKLISTIDEKESFIEGINLNKVAKDKLKANITQPVYTDEKGRQYTSLMNKQRTNPAGFEMLINYFDTLGLFNMDKSGNFKPDISKLKNVAKTKAVSELERVIESESERGVGRNTSLDASDKSRSILNMLESAMKGKK